MAACVMGSSVAHDGRGCETQLAEAQWKALDVFIHPIKRLPELDLETNSFNHEEQVPLRSAGFFLAF